MTDSQGEAESAPQESPDDEMKRKFREALEAKRSQQANADAGARGKDPAKIHGSHGPAAGKRSFRRRKSG